MKTPKIGHLVKMKDNHFNIKKDRIGLIVNQYTSFSGDIRYKEFGIYFPDTEQYCAWVPDNEFEIIDDPIKFYRG